MSKIDLTKLIYKNKNQQMKYVKKFEDFRLTEGAPAAPPKPTTTPPTTKPSRPTKPGKPIERPSVDPEPKAHNKKKTSLDVANRFIDELNKRGEDIKEYLK